MWHWGVNGRDERAFLADRSTAQVKIPVNQDEEVTVDKVIEEKRKEIEARAREREAKAAREAEAEKAKTKETDEKTKTQETDIASEGATPEGSPQALEEEAGQQAAFNPETGEINWDCPCLGGMAHGPCGEEFRAAFSCFVYSEEEPKGMDCIDKFQYATSPHFPFVVLEIGMSESWGSES